MSTTPLPDVAADRAAALFADKSPILVEVRFPRMAAAPDWFLCGDPAELAAVVGRLGPGAEVRLSSVWDLADPTGGVVLRT